MHPAHPAPLLLRGAELFAPEPLGRRDLLCAAGSIVAVEPHLDLPAALGTREIDASDLRVVPGLVDGHAHIAGAGGEGGPATRTPEMRAEEILAAGITTIVGLLGADGVTRSIDALLMKCKGLRSEGVSSWILTGAYQVPLPTLFGDVARDIALVEEVIGVGEIAIADHRSSGLSPAELERLVRRARLGGLLGGKAGAVILHLGDGADPFGLLRASLSTGELPLAQLVPTHVNRSARLLEEAKAWGVSGRVDVTACAWPAFPDEEVKPSTAIRELLEAGVPIAHITMSTDAGGSLPSFDDDGRLARITTGDPRRLWAEVRDAILLEGLPPAVSLRAVTSGPADALGLARKGRIAAGADADLLLVDDDWNPVTVVARGLVRTG
jgi:beta-aspartyl-dipeptidase (metallo-type)